MKLLSQKLLQQYLHDDSIKKFMDEHVSVEDEELTCQKYLRESAPKRLIFKLLYGDLLNSKIEKSKILDVGGGIIGLTNFLSINHDYFLIDLQAHNSFSEYKRAIKKSGRDFIYPLDWLDHKNDSYDIIIANDIFPNMDQRLEMFLEHYLPRCKQLRISLTWYNFVNYYQVKRIDKEDIFTMLSWDLKQLMSVIKKYKNCIIDYSPENFSIENISLYSNTRQVGIIVFRGNL
ncbi:hypothetical protein N8143_03525 [Pelagibacteraceae bacterium]|nr:hypothetical protein [Pelagibacteraceae bacterium]